MSKMKFWWDSPGSFAGNCLRCLSPCPPLRRVTSACRGDGTNRLWGAERGGYPQKAGACLYSWSAVGCFALRSRGWRLAEQFARNASTVEVIVNWKSNASCPYK